ncbi:hypothetical protein BDV98DRAFT_307100 [Pterulicium gracile]|uniref:Uncharacterized protein n=1 Tax=Pterulicium gracile TaxID=1884261 RepID=A0A5C3Q640_9AGAR|nr:hypothetical protein BDV98DRAFT_307100 [Pterula gracilis]
MACEAITELSVDIAHPDTGVVDLLECLDHPKVQTSLRSLDLHAHIFPWSYGTRRTELEDEEMVGPVLLQRLCEWTVVGSTMKLPALDKIHLSSVLAPALGGMDIWKMTGERERYLASTGGRFDVHVFEGSWAFDSEKGLLVFRQEDEKDRSVLRLSE